MMDVILIIRIMVEKFMKKMKYIIMEENIIMIIHLI